MKVLLTFTCRVPLEGKIVVTQISDTMVSSICDIAYDLERWAKWQKLEYWLKIVWLTSPELLSEQWDRMKKVTLNSVRRRPGLWTDLKEWITITRASYLENKFGASANLESFVVSGFDLQRCQGD